MTTPTWESLADQAINQMATWGKIFSESSNAIAVTLEIASVRASGWALGKSDQEIMSQVRENLAERGVMK